MLLLFLVIIFKKRIKAIGKKGSSNFVRFHMIPSSVLCDSPLKSFVNFFKFKVSKVCSVTSSPMSPVIMIVVVVAVVVVLVVVVVVVVCDVFESFLKVT